MASAQPGSVASAVVLGVVTLVTFSLAREKGPVSTVVRFHEGLLAGNRIQVSSALSEPLESPASNELMARASILLRASPNPQITRMSQAGRLSQVEVVYPLPGRGTDSIVFFLKKEASLWEIDPSRTLAPIASP